MAPGNGLVRAACNQHQTTSVPALQEHLVRVIHPFHPVAGQELRYLGEQRNRAGLRILGRDGEGVVWAMPVEWTDREPVDPELVLSAGRDAVVLVRDLLGLAEVIAGVKTA